MTAGEKPTTRLTLPRSRRLAHDREYEAVFAAKVRAMVGPLTVFSVPNEKGFCRLGLSIGKRVGGAVVRNRLKRMLREAFRLTKAQHSAEHPFFDFVISAREHKPAKLSEYQAWLLEAIGKSHASWKRRSEKQKGDAS